MPTFFRVEGACCLADVRRLHEPEAVGGPSFRLRSRHWWMKRRLRRENRKSRRITLGGNEGRCRTMVRELLPQGLLGFGGLVGCGVAVGLGGVGVGGAGGAGGAGVGAGVGVIFGAGGGGGTWFVGFTGGRSPMPI